MRHSRRAFLGTVGLGALAWACGGGKKTAAPAASGRLVATPVTTEVALGDSRMSFALLRADGTPFDPGKATKAALTLTLPDGSKRSIEAVAQSVRFGGGERHPDEEAEVHDIFPFRTDFDTPGTWQLEADVGGSKAGMPFTVLDRSSTVMAGGKAIATESPTKEDARGVNPICTRTPMCSMHDMTIADALGRDKPSVFVFATPKFCTARTCGPLVDVLEEIKADVGDKVSFVHIEVWKDEVSINSAAGVSPAFKAWKLDSDPWIFFVHADGSVKDRWSGAVGTEELTEAVKGLAG